MELLLHHPISHRVTCTTLGSRHSTASRTENTPCDTKKHARWDNMRVIGGPSIICVAFALSVCIFYQCIARHPRWCDEMRSGDCMAPRTGRQSRVYVYGVVAANSRVFSRVLIIDRSTSAKLVLLRIPFLFFSSSFLFLSLAFYSSLPSYLQETYLADGDDRVTENSLDPGTLCAECAIKLNNAPFGMH